METNHEVPRPESKDDVSDANLEALAGGMDFAALPPEINSATMYAGPGANPMQAAASAWDGLASELGASAAGLGGAIFPQHG